jgi:hypothetical protein
MKRIARPAVWILPAALLLTASPALAAKAAKAAAVAPSQQDSGAIPIPRAKPAGLVKRMPAVSWPGLGNGWPEDEVRAARTACGPLLDGLDIDWKPLEPIGSAGGCGTPAPIEVSAIAGVRLDPPATVNCKLAAKLQGWIADAVQPAARRDLKTQVEVIHTASSYVCRRRNNQASGKLSEHGRANALDMAGFSFARSKEVTVADGWGGLLQKIGLSRQGSFLGDIRKDACYYFTTVLGPGSDAYHGDHFHVDTIARNNDYRICK